MPTDYKLTCIIIDDFTSRSFTEFADYDIQYYDYAKSYRSYTADYYGYYDGLDYGDIDDTGIIPETVVYDWYNINNLTGKSLDALSGFNYAEASKNNRTGDYHGDDPEVVDYHYYDNIDSMNSWSQDTPGHGDWVLKAFTDSLDDKSDVEIIAVDIDYDASGDVESLFEEKTLNGETAPFLTFLYNYSALNDLHQTGEYHLIVGINASFTYAPEQAISSVGNLLSSGMFVVQAAPNVDSYSVDWGTYLSNVINVGAWNVDQNGYALAANVDALDTVDVFANGYIERSGWGRGWNFGTSFATPRVFGEIVNLFDATVLPTLDSDAQPPDSSQNLTEEQETTITRQIVSEITSSYLVKLAGENDQIGSVHVSKKTIDDYGIQPVKVPMSSPELGYVFVSAQEFTNASPAGSVTISGPPLQGQRLTASHSISDADGVGTVTYQWFSSGSSASIGTGSSYQIRKSDIGKTITVRASYTDSYGTAEVVVSNATGIIASEFDDTLSAPSDSGWSINGFAGKDVINGGAGNDTLNGGAGDDTLSGGAGNDVYYVDAKGDFIVESSGNNTPAQQIFRMGIDNDVVIASVSYTLTANAAVEDMMAAGPLTGLNKNPAIDLTGNELGQGLIGNNAKNTLAGMDGDDALVGMGGDDVLNGGAGNDVLIGGVGNDTLKGGADNDRFLFNIGSTTCTTLTGESVSIALTGGSDKLDGGDGQEDAIILTGSLDNYVLRKLSATEYSMTAKSVLAGSSSAEKVTFKNIERLGFISAVSDLESDNLTFVSLASIPVVSDFDDTLNAPSASDWSINGLAGKDVINGGAGNDTLNGGAGDDTLTGGAGADSISGGNGNDVLLGFSDYEDYRLYDPDFSAWVQSQLSVTDQLHGGKGNDIYIFDGMVGTPTVHENPNEGTDTILGDLASYTLVANVENYVNDLNLTDNGTPVGITITGNGLNNILKSSPASWDEVKVILSTVDENWTANEFFYGLGGADTLMGGGGNDLLSGGEGNDRLTGGAGSDQFVFDAPLNAIGNLDTVTDFTRGSDLIVLDQHFFAKLASGVSPGNLVVNNTGRTADTDDYLIFNTNTKALLYDPDGSGVSSSPIRFAILTGISDLSHTDFMIA